MSEVELREHLEAQIRWLREYVDVRFAEAERALALAARRDLVEPLRERLSAIEGRLLPMVAAGTVLGVVIGGILTTVAMRLFGIAAVWK